MSPKSRRRGRHLPRSKRRKGRRVFTAPVAQPVAQGFQPTPRAEIPLPPAKAPTPKAPVTVAQVPEVTAELKRIGILSGIILVILVVLFFVLT